MRVFSAAPSIPPPSARLTRHTQTYRNRGPRPRTFRTRWFFPHLLAERYLVFSGLSPEHPPFLKDITTCPRQRPSLRRDLLPFSPSFSVHSISESRLFFFPRRRLLCGFSKKILRAQQRSCSTLHRFVIFHPKRYSLRKSSASQT